MPKSKKNSRKSKPQLANFSDLFLANLIDAIILFVMSVISYQFLFSQNTTQNNLIYYQSIDQLIAQKGSLSNIFVFSISLMALSYLSLYYLILWVAGNGQTIGYRILGLKLIRDNGEKITYPIALLRFLAAISSFIFLFLGFFYSLYNKKRKTWHDYVCHTSVIRE